MYCGVELTHLKALRYFILVPGHTVHAVLYARGELEQIVGIILVGHKGLLPIRFSRRRITQPRTKFLIDNLVEHGLTHRIQIAGCRSSTRYAGYAAICYFINVKLTLGTLGQARIAAVARGLYLKVVEYGILALIQAKGIGI